jgi:hypothetical protein
MVQVLQMTFRTGTGREFRISLDNPKADLTPAQIQAAMNTIVSKNVFNVDGGLIEALSANVVSTQTQPIALA